MQPSHDAPPRAAGDQVDVEQIMRDIRARIAQRHGIELTAPQIQELAARRLEAILDPRTVSPSLMEQLRRSAGATAAAPAPTPPDPGYSFEDTTLYESHRGILRVIRRLLNPLLKLLFNPNPLIHALHTQARLNREAAAREAERERLQTEWNALHYEVLKRLVAEVARVTVEMQALSARTEALSGRVDFNDRRVRAMEATASTARAPQRQGEAAPATTAAPAEGKADGKAPEQAAGDASGDATRRRRRRRRGRRGGAGPADATAMGAATDDAVGVDGMEDEDEDEASVEPSAAAVSPPADPPVGAVAREPASAPEPVASAPEAVAAPIAPAVPPSPAAASAPFEAPEPIERPAPPRDEPAPAVSAERPGAEPPER